MMTQTAAPHDAPHNSPNKQDQLQATSLLTDKLRAFGYHFLLSAMLLALAGGVVFYVWYPSPFFGLFGVLPVFLLMLGVDLIVGPLLTFIVYKKGKKTLKMDLAVIGLLQLLAFGWGMWSIANARPAWLVLYQDALFAVSPSTTKDAQGKPQALPIWQQPWGKPLPVMVTTAPNSNASGTPQYYQAQQYTAYQGTTAVKAALPLSKVQAYDANFYQHIIQRYPQIVGYFPIISDASTKIAIALINKDGTIADIVLNEQKER